MDTNWRRYPAERRPWLTMLGETETRTAIALGAFTSQLYFMILLT